LQVVKSSLFPHLPAESIKELSDDPADQKSIDLPDLQRRTLQQARTSGNIPTKSALGVDLTSLFDRIGDTDRQELATVSANLPTWASAGRMRPFATDADVEDERHAPAVENLAKTYLAPALHMPEAILVGSSLGGGLPGWIRAARSNGAPFSAIGKGPAPDPANGPQPSPTLASLYPAPVPVPQPSQPSALATTAGTPRLTPFAPTPDPMQPATTLSGLRTGLARYFSPPGGS
jgi:hypothetical protein